MVVVVILNYVLCITGMEPVTPHFICKLGVRVHKTILLEYDPWHLELSSVKLPL